MIWGGFLKSEVVIIFTALVDLCMAVTMQVLTTGPGINVRALNNSHLAVRQKRPERQANGWHSVTIDKMCVLSQLVAMELEQRKSPIDNRSQLRPCLGNFSTPLYSDPQDTAERWVPILLVHSKAVVPYYYQLHWHVPASPRDSWYSYDRSVGVRNVLCRSMHGSRPAQWSNRPSPDH